MAKGGFSIELSQGQQQTHTSRTITLKNVCGSPLRLLDTSPALLGARVAIGRLPLLTHPYRTTFALRPVRRRGLQADNARRAFRTTGEVLDLLLGSGPVDGGVVDCGSNQGGSSS